MPEYRDNYFDVDALLNGLVDPSLISYEQSLKELFDKRVKSLEITPTSALQALGIQSRTLKGILNGTQKVTDYTNLIRIADFLQVPKERVALLYLKVLEKNFPTELDISPKKIQFIRENFDLAALKKAGFIESISDYKKIEDKIVNFLGLKSIFEYTQPKYSVAFSSGLIEPKNSLNRSLWVDSSRRLFKEIDNPNPFNRDLLIDYFPEIRWHSTNIELGLISVIKNLYKMGVTVVYQSYLPSIHLRGAIFSVNNKPCIVLTNYKGFYPTLWFALVHELFHVLFDWDEIKKNAYHFSEEDSDQLTLKVKEQEADDFAREFLFSKQKTVNAKAFINDIELVSEYALRNHVHPSFVYVFNAFDLNINSAWARARKMNPTKEMEEMLSKIDNPWNNTKPVTETAKLLIHTLYS